MALKPTVGIIHDGGATFQFEPIDNVFTAIFLGKKVTRYGDRYYPLNTVGPWSPVGDAPGQPGYEETEREAYDLAWAFAKYVQEGTDSGSYWGGELHDVR